MRYGRSTAARRAARTLKYRLWFHDCLAILPGYGWHDGGCAILALALRRWLGPDARLMGIWKDQRLQHVVCQVGRYYLDGDGLSAGPTLLARWRRIALCPSLELRPVCRQTILAQREIPVNARAESALAGHLAAHLSADALRALANEAKRESQTISFRARGSCSPPRAILSR